jgi:ATP-binding cassette subfamily C protein
MQPALPDERARAPGDAASASEEQDSDLASLIRIFTPRERRHIALLAIAQVIGVGLEVASVGVMVPLVALFANPQRIYDYPRAVTFIDALGLRQPREVLLAACAGVFALFAVKNAYLLALLWVQYRIVFSKQARLSTALLRGYMYSPWALHLRRNSAELLRNILQQVDTFINYVLNPLLVFFAEQLVSVAVLGLLLFFQPVVAALAIAIVGSAGFVAQRAVQRRAREAGLAQQRYLKDRIQWINQAFGGLKEAKLHGKEPYFVQAYSASAWAYVREHRFMFITSNMQRLVLEMALLGGFLLVTALLLVRGSDLERLLPTMALFGVATVRLLPSLSRAVQSLARARYYWPVVRGLDRELAEMARREAADREGDTAAPLQLERQITVRNLSYRYPETDGDALTNVNLEIPRGSTTAITGASGAGKTTLIDVILGLLSPREGAVLVDDADIAGRTRAWQRNVGCVPQDVYLLDDTVRRNVAFGVPDAEIDDERVWEALEQAQVADVVSALSDRLDTGLGERGTRLSGGQRQRIGIARALYTRPDVLVLDEATSAVDVETERQLSNAIDRLGGDKTLIIIAHRESTIAKCDRRFELVGGRLVGGGAPAAANRRGHAPAPSPS